VGVAELLEDLNPQRTRLWVVTGTGALGRAVDPGRAAAYLIRTAAFCHDLRLQTRRIVRICLKPGDAAMMNRLAGPDATRVMAGLTGLDAGGAANALAMHLGLAAHRAEGLALPGAPDGTAIVLDGRAP
jgi:hypothetical protein